MEKGQKGLIAVKKAFASYDTDNSGELSMDEFEAAMQRLNLGASDQEIDELYHVFDKNNDGSIVF